MLFFAVCFYISVFLNGFISLSSSSRALWSRRVGVGACSFSLTIRSAASASVGSGGSSRGSAVRIRSSLRRSPRHRCRRGLTRSGRSSSRRRRGGARRADNLTIPHELVQGSLKILGKLGCASLAKFVANHLCVGRNESRWRGLMAFRQVLRRGRPAKVAKAIDGTAWRRQRKMDVPIAGSVARHSRAIASERKPASLSHDTPDAESLTGPGAAGGGHYLVDGRQLADAPSRLCRGPAARGSGDTPRRPREHQPTV